MEAATHARYIEFHTHFKYCPRTGKLFWKTPTSNRRILGEEAGTITNGYLVVKMNRKRYRVHRVIFQMHNPTVDIDRCVIDHIDRNPLNNLIENLRPATVSQNLANSKRRIDNTSGYKGVHLFSRTGKWQAYLNINSLRKHLGYFSSAEEAAAAYDRAAESLFGNHALTNKSLGLL